MSVRRRYEAESIIARARARRDRGEFVDAEDVIRAHPALAEDLREGFDAVARLDRALGPARAPADHGADALVGTRVRGWRVVARLGSGGMGDVYVAEGLGVPARVAVKVIRPHLLDRPGFRERFLREAEVGTRIRHENVVATYGCESVVVPNGRLDVLVMEHVEGQTLRAMLDELDRVPEDLCRHVGREIAKGLAAIHAAGVVHRDLKPDNVIVTRDHVVKVMDLGVALLADEAARLSQTGAFVGSVHYAAPEQFGGVRVGAAGRTAARGAVGSTRRAEGDARIDGRADLHALGILLYELSTGAHPYPDDDFREVLRRLLTERPRRASELNQQLTPFFEEVVAKLLEKDPARRFASAEELLRVLTDGEESAWWHDRARAIRDETKRPLRRIRIPRETALHGREAEIATLRGLFEKAEAGEGQVLLLEGEAGIGKSRLIDEFAALLHRGGRDFHFLFGSYPPGGAATASGAFTTAYREHFGEASLEDALLAHIPATPHLVPAFAALLRGDVAPTDSAPLTKESIQTLFVHTTRALADERPTIVLVEDLHFAPADGRALFASLALAVRGHRILLVGCTRPGLDEAWMRQLSARAPMTRLPLPRLGPKELVHLLRDALGSARLAEELGGLVAVKSDGNPFFVFELLRGLKEGQFLRQRPDGTWETTRVLRDIQVPSSITDLVQARVADMADEDRNLLDVASCCGFEFDPLVVASALALPRILAMQRFARIEKRHRLVRSVGPHYAFDHHQVQETIYSGLHERLRESCHAAIAAALEASAGAAAKEPEDLDGALCAELAGHFLRGAEGAKALRYLDPALDHLERTQRQASGAELIERALAYDGLVRGAPRVRLLLRLCQPNGLLDILGQRARHHATASEARQIAGALQDDDLLRRAAHAQAVACLRSSRLAEAEECERFALLIAQRRGDRRTEAIATGNLGIILGAGGQLLDGVRQHERHLEISREIGDAGEEARALENLADALRALGRFDEARCHAARAVALHGSRGDRRSEASATGVLGRIAAGQGRLAEAREHYERELRMYREIGGREGTARALVNLASTTMALGDLDRPRELLASALQVCREIGAHYGEGYVRSAMANLEDELGDTAAAMEHVDAALALRRSIGHRDGIAQALISRGMLLLRAGDGVGSRAALEEALTLASQLGLRSDVALTLALLTPLRGDDPRAAIAALEAAGACEHSLRIRLLLWQVTLDRAHLAEARSLLDSVLASAPPECRGAMIAHRRLLREASEALAQNGA